jgi:hypothetical protein
MAPILRRRASLPGPPPSPCPVINAAACLMVARWWYREHINDVGN